MDNLLTRARDDEFRRVGETVRLGKVRDVGGHYVQTPANHLLSKARAVIANHRRAGPDQQVFEFTAEEFATLEAALAQHLQRAKGSKPFEACYTVQPNGCWEWNGIKDHYGYGRFKCRSAHRVSFRRSNGPIPPGMFVCHSCDNPACVNPTHLWLGTAKDNTQDMVAKGRARNGSGPIAALAAQPLPVSSDEEKG